MSGEMSPGFEIREVFQIDLADDGNLLVDVFPQILPRILISIEFGHLKIKMEVAAEGFQHLAAGAPQIGIIETRDYTKSEPDSLGETKNHRLAVSISIEIQYIPDRCRNTVIAG
jgi:hypothetical protein